MANKEQHKDKKKPKQAKAEVKAPAATHTTPISAVKGGKLSKKK